MTSDRFAAITLTLSIPVLMSCELGRAEVERRTPIIRISAGVPTGTFGPFSEALVQGYAKLLPELKIELVEQSRSVRNLEALENGTVDLGLAQSGVAYMAYNGRLPETDRPLRNTYLNQLDRIETLSIDIVLLTRKDLDADLVRRLTAGLFQMLPRLSSELDFLRGMDPGRAPATPIPLHRGATLYYRERELRR